MKRGLDLTADYAERLAKLMDVINDRFTGFKSRYLRIRIWDIIRTRRAVITDNVHNVISYLYARPWKHCDRYYSTDRFVSRNGLEFEGKALGREFFEYILNIFFFINAYTSSNIVRFEF